MTPYTAGALSPPSFKKYMFRYSDLKSPFLSRELYSKACLDIMSTTQCHFDVYEYWQKTGELCTYPELLSNNTIVSPQTATADYAGLLSCYDLAVLLEERRFQDAVISKLIRRLRSYLPDKEIFVQQLTPSVVDKMITTYGSDAPLYRLLVKAAARFGSLQQIGAFTSADYPLSFRADLTMQLALLREKTGGPRDFAENECEFHWCRGGGYQCTARDR